MEIKRTEEIAGTSLMGYTETTRAELVRAFGEPIEYGLGDKVTIEWGLEFPDGIIATIYDWKRYEQGAPALDESYTYHVGGHSKEALVLVDQALRERVGA